ncbi:F-box protein [Phanerochaete sordida]|uniref:F-box protein n=1 Tax=Phanerochaete sordida TaxID=48140 RepID=A0A9P3LKN8_9APHY|nr:F-box protein [Phanerochaete sordida]
MHLSLNIDEIIQNIFGHVDKKGTLFRLAVVCRAWSEPANDALWARLEGLRPLICCLPQHVIAESEIMYGALTIVQAPSEGEWERFDENARRVKHLLVDDSRLFSVDHAAMEVLRKHHADPILPNLTYLEWHGGRIAQHIHLFVRPSLLSFVFTAHGVESARAVLEQVETHAPQLHELRVISRGHTMQVLRPDILRTTMSLQSLTDFDDATMRLSADDLVCLSQLKHLRSAWITLDQTNAAAASRSDWGGFPGAAAMTITTNWDLDGPCSVSNLIPRISSSRLTSLTLSISPPQSIARLQADMSALGGFQRLEMFSLLGKVCNERWDGMTLDGVLLSHMSRITTMKSFTIRNIPMVLPRNIIHDLSVAWTRLESFTAIQLNTLRPIVRLEDLHLFSQHCLRLRTLSVYVRVERGWTYELANPLVPSSLRSLDLAYSPVSLPANTPTAAYLAAVFPFAEISHVAIDVGDASFVFPEPFPGAEAPSVFARVIEPKRELFRATTNAKSG